jgi:hypothetical protein
MAARMRVNADLPLSSLDSGELGTKVDRSISGGVLPWMMTGEG